MASAQSQDPRAAVRPTGRMIQPASRLRIAARWTTAACLLGLFCNKAWTADIRFYTINKKQQQSEVALVVGTKKPGCHNFFPRRRVYRVAQVGFRYCRLFAEKDCRPDSAVTASWKNRKDPTDQLTPGSRWFLAGKRGVEIASWECQNAQ